MVAATHPLNFFYKYIPHTFPLSNVLVCFHVFMNFLKSSLLPNVFAKTMSRKSIVIIPSSLQNSFSEHFWVCQIMVSSGNREGKEKVERILKITGQIQNQPKTQHDEGQKENYVFKLSFHLLLGNPWELGKVYLTGIHKENTLRTILFILTKNSKKFLRNLIRTVTINWKNSALKAFPVGICY